MTETQPSQSKIPSLEKKIIFLVAAVQFVNIVEFMIVMPMGPDFAEALAIPSSKIGLIGAAYTITSAVCGWIASYFLDRFDRRVALLSALFGLSIGTAAVGFAQGLPSLLLARMIAGAFGGPATSLSMSIIADSVPHARRGRAMGIVMGAFSMASIFGVPLGLELARFAGWRFPFFVISAAILIATSFASIHLPSFRAHLEPHHQKDLKNSNYRFWRKEVIFSLSAMALAMFGAFMVIPNFSAFFQYNLGFPRERLSWLYFFGGILSLISLRIAGIWIDKKDATRVAIVGSFFMGISLLLGYGQEIPLLSAPLIFVCFMVGTSMRGAALNTVNSRVPRPHERARFMATTSSFIHLSNALGAYLSTLILTQNSSSQLIGMHIVARISLILALGVPLLVRWVEQHVRFIEKNAQ